MVVILGSRAKGYTFQGRHRRFVDDSALHTSFLGAPLLVGDIAEVVSWYRHLQQQVQSLTPHNYMQVYTLVPSTLYVAHTYPRTVSELFAFYCTAVCTC